MYVVHTLYICPKIYYKIVVSQVLEMCFVTFSGGNQLHWMRSLSIVLAKMKLSVRLD